MTNILQLSINATRADFGTKRDRRYRYCVSCGTLLVNNKEMKKNIHNSKTCGRSECKKICEDHPGHFCICCGISHNALSNRNLACSRECERFFMKEIWETW